MKKISAFIVAVLICFTALSIPAKRGIITATQPDGSVVLLRLHGDEFCHWVTNASGQIVEKNADGYWRPVKSTASSPNAHRVMANTKRNFRNRSNRTGEHIGMGQKHFLLILVEFADVRFSSPETAHDDFYDLMNKPGYDYNGATGSARDYYYENSHGQFEPLFDVYGPVTLSHDQEYYGGNDKYGYDLRPEQAVYEACIALDEQIDYSLYDNDNDGVVDLVYMYYAGYSEAEGAPANCIWPHQWDFTSAGINLVCDGKKIDSYACSSELVYSGLLKDKLTGIGTSCHEFGHAIGLPDSYDVDYETNGEAAGLFNYSLMAGGSYNNEGRTPPYLSIEARLLLGWTTEDAIKEFDSDGPVSLAPVQENVAYKTPTDTDGEYFIYECRGSSGWDAYLPAPGLIISHIDKSERLVTILDLEGNASQVAAVDLWSYWKLTNCINENGTHPCYYIVPAADQSNLLFGYENIPNYGNYFIDENGPRIPFPGSDGVTNYTAVSWNGVESEISLSNISYTNNLVTFDVKLPKAGLDYPVIHNPKNGIYQSGDAFDLGIILPDNISLLDLANMEWFLDDEPKDGASVVLTAGEHTVEAIVYLKSGETFNLTLEISVE